MHLQVSGNTIMSLCYFTGETIVYFNSFKSNKKYYYYYYYLYVSIYFYQFIKTKHRIILNEKLQQDIYLTKFEK